MVDISKMKLGDEVTVRGHICTIDTDHNGIAISEQWWRPDGIISHTPKPREFKPGDRVKSVNFEGTHTVVATDGIAVWLRQPTGGHFTSHVENLRHADEGGSND